MKIRQTVRHAATRKALETPVVGEKMHDWLVEKHVDIFIARADADHREERRAHLTGLFDGTVDMYLAALQAGFTEATAREVTHVVANFDFYNHGWTEMMEFPPGEIDDHYERYADFFERHGVTLDDPLGEFRPDDGVPEAPSTPERLDDPSSAVNAEGGYADDVYVDDGEDVRRGGGDGPDADVSDAPGLGES